MKYLYEAALRPLSGNSNIWFIETLVSVGSFLIQVRVFLVLGTVSDFQELRLLILCKYFILAGNARFHAYDLAYFCACSSRDNLFFRGPRIQVPSIL